MEASNKIACFLAAFAVVAASLLQPSAAATPNLNFCPLPPGQQAECRSSLMPMVPGCAGFLTNTSVFEPESSCCDGFNSIMAPESFTCICHVMNHDLNQLLPAPLHHMRMVELFTLCARAVDQRLLAALCDQCGDQLPPMDLPNHRPLAPAPAPAPAN
ncbi:hypothetical protein ACP70R_023122 [Stipagrostis hirtigluma subsp. patula]